MLLLGGLAAGPAAAEQNGGGGALDKAAFKAGCEAAGGSYVENRDGSFQCNGRHGGVVKCPDTTSPCTFIPPAQHGQPTDPSEGTVGIIWDGIVGAIDGGGEVPAAPANEPPAAEADASRVAEDGTLRRDAAKGLLANDADPDGDELAARVVKGPRNGKLALKADGSFAYTPKRDFHGTDRFTYEVSDGRGGTATATATIKVQARPE